MSGMTQSMQYTMPLMFGFFSLSFPSGLSIYFVLSNVIGIGQGYLTKRNMDKEKAAMAARDDMPKTTGLPAEAKASASANPGSSQSSKRKRGSSSKRKRRSAKR